jgi:hypothetical protein
VLIDRYSRPDQKAGDGGKPAKPLSDSKIADLLAEQGIMVATHDRKVP